MAKKLNLKTQVMDIIAANGGSATFTEINKALFPIRYGRVYDPISDRGYHCDRFYSYLDYFYHPTKSDARYITHDAVNHRFILHNN